MAALPPTPGSTDPVHSGNGLAFLSRPRWKLSPFLGFCSEPHNRAIQTRRLHEGYWRARRGLCCWNSNNFNMNIKQPCENKTKQNKTLWLPGPGEVLFIGCFALWVSHVISPSLPIAFLPHPHPTPTPNPLSVMHSYPVHSGPSLQTQLLTLPGAQLTERTFHWNLIHSSWIVMLVDSKHFIVLNYT